MVYNNVMGLTLIDRGYEIKVDKSFNPSCKVCGQTIKLSDKFYYCKDKKIFWCERHRFVEWKECNYQDNHEHFNIIGVDYSD